MDGQKRHRGRPATGRSVDSLEAHNFKRAVWSGSRSRVWLTKRVHQTWEISKGMSLFKTGNDFAAHLLSLEMAKAQLLQRSGSGYRHVLHQLALDKLQTSTFPRQYLDGKSPRSFLSHVLYQILWTNKTERL